MRLSLALQDLDGNAHQGLNGLNQIGGVAGIARGGGGDDMDFTDLQAVQQPLKPGKGIESGGNPLRLHGTSFIQAAPQLHHRLFIDQRRGKGPGPVKQDQANGVRA